jgi:SAM-dependent methyltransferase
LSNFRGPRRLASALVYKKDLSEPNLAERLPVRINQVLFEHGLSPPWIWSAERCKDYWSSVTDPADPNSPTSYAGKPQAIVEFLHQFWQPEVTPAMKILEVGCNAGANLHGLYERSYRTLSGVEINPSAISEMRSSFPELGGSEVHEGSLEDVFARLPSNSVDVVFSMAVLMHVHPSSKQVFAEMARIARRYVCVVEAEMVTISYIFARNYRRVFERLGCAEVRSTQITANSSPAVDDGYFGYTARLFRAPTP